MRNSKRAALVLAGVLSAVVPNVIESIAASPATAYDASVCTAATPPAGFIVERLGSGDDEKVHSASDLTPYIIYGGGGRDNIVGGGGGDIICGGSGNDGLNGGPGDDLIVGEGEKDFVVGNSGNDKLYGGNDDDALYGGDGIDTVYGDASTDFVRGGEYGDATTSVGVCPPSSSTWYATMMGVFNPARFTMQNSCRTVSAYIVHGSKADPSGGDGDQHFKIRVGGCTTSDPLLVVEFTPRDKPYFSNLIDWTKGTCNNPVTLTGAYVLDCVNHPCGPERDGKEIHPVFEVKYNGVVRRSGPQYGGSPWEINPSADGQLPRFCWNERGTPCVAWNNGAAFS